MLPLKGRRRLSTGDDGERVLRASRGTRAASIGAVLCLALTSCGDGSDATRTPVALENVTAGVWDATISQDDETALTVADVQGNMSAAIPMAPRGFGSLTFEGPLNTDGAATLTGGFSGSDFFVQLDGSATATRTGTMERMTGSLAGFSRPPYTFELTRDNDRTPERFSGTYTFLLTTTAGRGSTVALTVDVSTDGHASFANTVETARADGTIIADLTAGSVLVSPSGRLRLSARYETRTPGCPLSDPFNVGLPFDSACVLILTADLGDGTESAGRFRVDVPNLELRWIDGDWTATRR